MSDVRALLASRAVDVGDGPYLERLDLPQSRIEDFLRAGLAHVPKPWDFRSAAFIRDTNSREVEMSALSDGELGRALQRSARAMQRRGFVDDLVAQAFAIVREAARRTLGMRHHDVQLLAGRALLNGKIAEMATGEGKTLAATLAICTAASTGAAVHVVTVNDYLAMRDMEDNLRLFAFFGLTAGNVKQDMEPDERRSHYARDIVYVSNKELTFDYLKDRISHGTEQFAQRKLRELQGRHAHLPLLRGLHVAFVDEADSVLIDEARTPLIISETIPDELGQEIYHQAIELVSGLTVDSDYVMRAERDIWLTEAGHTKVAVLCQGLTGIWNSELWRRELTQKALSALYCFHRDRHYILQENKVQIVDEFTGRVMPDRTWERGLHQMIEAKEGCEITGQRRTLSQITYQRFLGRYLLLGGMTGTAKEVEPEIKRVYDLSVVRVPTHKASRRIRLPDRVFADHESRWQAVAERAASLAANGRAVLVGTRSVEASETLSRLLTARGVEHTVLNARQDSAEADAVAQAGQCGRITVATNMAGRGTDIKLSQDARERGGLHVILTEFHESARIDRQLFGRSARQGDPGSVEAYVCLQDQLFRNNVPVLGRLFGRYFAQVPDPGRAFRYFVSFAQRRSESQNRKIRLDTIKRDKSWLLSLGFVGASKK